MYKFNLEALRLKTEALILTHTHMYVSGSLDKCYVITEPSNYVEETKFGSSSLQLPNQILPTYI